jgi:hypothetical protein
VIRWNDRQFRLPNHVANKISNGATRNIVIRNGVSKGLNEEGIREDLEHIHNLVVISVTINKGNIYISTNSVHNALFARTCMMSRSLYKGLKIDWYPDECASPLSRVREKAISPPSPQAVKGFAENRQNHSSNSKIFALLAMDEADESDASEEDNLQSQALISNSSGVSINWADSMIVA